MKKFFLFSVFLILTLSQQAYGMKTTSTGMTTSSTQEETLLRETQPIIDSINQLKAQNPNLTFQIRLIHIYLALRLIDKTEAAENLAKTFSPIDKLYINLVEAIQRFNPKFIGTLSALLRSH
jgi:hypothetical protein